MKQAGCILYKDSQLVLIPNIDQLMYDITVVNVISNAEGKNKTPSYHFTVTTHAAAVNRVHYSIGHIVVMIITHECTLGLVVGLPDRLPIHCVVFHTS
jgi:hypothetical protein